MSFSTIPRWDRLFRSFPKMRDLQQSIKDFSGDIILEFVWSHPNTEITWDRQMQTQVQFLWSTLCQAKSMHCFSLNDKQIFGPCAFEIRVSMYEVLKDLREYCGKEGIVMTLDTPYLEHIWIKKNERCIEFEWGESHPHILSLVLYIRTRINTSRSQSATIATENHTYESKKLFSIHIISL